MATVGKVVDCCLEEGEEDWATSSYLKAANYPAQR